MAEMRHLTAWLQEHSVAEAVMESTAQYWRPVWLSLDVHFQLHLAQPLSNAAPKGRKTDFADAVRPIKRFKAVNLPTRRNLRQGQRTIKRTIKRGVVQAVGLGLMRIPAI